MEQTITQFNKLLQNFRDFKNFKDLTVNSIEDIKKIPFTTRKDLETWKIDQCPEKPLYILNTSGTHGSATMLYVSKESYEKRAERMKKILETVEVSKDYPVISLLDFPVFQTIFESCGYSNIYVGELTSDNKPLIIKKILKNKPHFLFAFNSTIYDLLTEIKRMGRQIPFKKICFTGTQITQEFKDNIRSMCSAELYDTYGTSELAAFAVEEKEDDGWLLLLDEYVHFEILTLKNEIVGEGKGKLVLTDLYNFSMPIVRYLLGDYVEIKKKYGKRYIKMIERYGDYLNLEGDIYSKFHVIKKMIKVLGHDKFMIIIDNDRVTLHDKLEIHLQKKDFEKKDTIRKMISQWYDINEISFTEFIQEKRSAHGKRINVIDKRFKG